jgi:2,3-bisphosphoglycerate-dependent phosphoglycerate mutase
MLRRNPHRAEAHDYHIHPGGQCHDDAGRTDFVQAFFSTISGNLETNGWGSRFPVVLNELYQGKLRKALAAGALPELRQIRNELSAISPSRVIWDIENLSKRLAWGNAISREITSLADYFVTSAGGDMFEALTENVEYLAAEPDCEWIELIDL